MRRSSALVATTSWRAWARPELYTRGVSLRGPVVTGGSANGNGNGNGNGHGPSDSGGEAATGLRSSHLGEEDLQPAWFTGIDRLHISGHGLLNDTMASAVVGGSRIARGAGARVGVDLATASLIRFVGPELYAERLSETRPDVVFGTDEEFEALPGEPRAPILIVKRGAAGVVVRFRGREFTDPAPDVPVVDETGTGDAYAAGFHLGDTLDDCLARARLAAGRCLSHVGAMPPGEPRPLEATNV